jgi:hypothetical protein
MFNEIHLGADPPIQTPIDSSGPWDQPRPPAGATLLPSQGGNWLPAPPPGGLPWDTLIMYGGLAIGAVILLGVFAKRR